MSNQSTEAATLRLPERFNVESAGAVLAQIEQGMRGASAIRVDCSRVSVVDSAGLQLLVVARRAADTAGKRLDLEEVPSGLAEDARLLGVEQLLGLA